MIYLRLKNFQEIGQRQLFLKVFGLCGNIGDKIDDLQAGFLLWSHLSRSATLMHDLALKLGITAQKEIDNYFFVGLLHDIGKLCVSSCLLSKPAELTVSEKKQMDFHVHKDFVRRACESKLGIRFSSLPVSVYEGARFHHQNLDATGYPQNDDENFSPSLTLKALAIVDKFEAGTSNLRPWQDRKDYFKIFLELQSGAEDGKLDKDVLMVFFSYLFGEKINNLTCLPLIFKDFLKN